MRTVFWKLLGGPTVHGHRTVSSVKIGVWVVVLSLVIGWLAFNKIMVKQWFTPSETIKAQFASNGVIEPYFSKVKVNFVPIGMVTGVERLDDGTSLVTMEVDTDIPRKLGTEPTATIRPTTLLGGNYFIDLKPGGQSGTFQGTIPTARTTLPVELDKVLRTIQPEAQVGLRGTVKKLDETLAGGGREAIQRLVSDAPGSLKPAAEVLDAARGTNPKQDLTDFVTGFENTARALTDKPGQLHDIARDFATTAASFGRQSAPVANAINELPGALASADRGLIRLNVTLDVLRDTAADVRPTAHELDQTLDKLDPVLHDARPVVSDLRELASDAKDTLEDLAPVAKDATDILDDLKGPVLDRVNGPVKKLILNDYQGVGPYAQTKTEKKIFEELGYMVNNLDRATTMDRNGSAIPFQVDPSYPELLENLIANNGRPRTESVGKSLINPVQPPKTIELPKSLQPAHPGGESSNGKQQIPLPSLPKLPLGGN